MGEFVYTIEMADPDTAVSSVDSSFGGQAASLHNTTPPPPYQAPPAYDTLYAAPDNDDNNLGSDLDEL